jgi:rhamnosyl/mannosyltransferase
VGVHEETGILFPVDDVQTLKTALERLVNDPDLRERLGSTGKERVRANFSIDLFCRKIKALYS